MPARPLRFLLPAAVLLGLAAVPLTAAPSKLTLPAKHRAVLSPVPLEAPRLHQARIDGLRDNGPAALDQPLGSGWALAGFDLRFGNGDHKLRRIGVLGEERFVRFALADSNGDDPFRAAARLTSLPGIRVQQVSADGGGKFEIPLPGAARPGHTLVLSGFEFRRRDGTDANLRNIGVWLDPQRNVARVSLTDDQGLDFRGLEASLGAVVASTLVPLPGLLEAGSVTATTQAGTRGIAQMAGRYRAYRVTVQYAWIPDAMVAAKGALAGTRGQRSRPPADRIDALQGFEFTFNNSDHHLLGLGLNGSGTGGVFFQDNNTDDPMQWSATYVTLRGVR